MYIINYNYKSKFDGGFMRFRIDLKIFLFLIVFYFTKQIEIYIIMIIFAIIHELGHLICGLIIGLKPEKLELMPTGLAISFKTNVDYYNKKIGRGNLFNFKKIIVAIAGPLTNLLMVVIFSFINIDYNLKLMIIYSNWLMFFFNLLPIYPLDGGRIIQEFLHIKMGINKSRDIVNDVSIIVMIILTSVGSIGILYYKNIAIFFIIIYLWILVINENIKFRRRKKLLKDVKDYL